MADTNLNIARDQLVCVTALDEGVIVMPHIYFCETTPHFWLTFHLPCASVDIRNGHLRLPVTCAVTDRAKQPSRTRHISSTHITMYSTQETRCQEWQVLLHGMHRAPLVAPSHHIRVRTNETQPTP